MQQLMQNLIESNESNGEIPEGCFLNESDGLVYCEKCQKQKQVAITWMGVPHIVNCQCECETKVNAETRMAHMEANRLVKVRAARNICFGEATKMYDWTFDRFEVTSNNSKNHKIGLKYAQNFSQMKCENIGLNLCGNKGTGKTYLAACIANAVIDKGYSVYFRTMDQLVGQVFKSFDKNTEVSEICSYDLLIIDEFGTEAETSTVQQYVYDIINTRVVQKKPFIITTNVITPEKERMTMADQRIYSRFGEALMTIAFTGADMRERIHETKADIFKRLLQGE